MEDVKFDRDPDAKNKDKACILKRFLTSDSEIHYGSAGKATTLDFLCRTHGRINEIQECVLRHPTLVGISSATKCQLADVAKCRKNFFRRSQEARRNSVSQSIWT